MIDLTTYPSTPVPSYCLKIDHKFLTEVTPYGLGGETRLIKRRFPRHNFSLIYDALGTDPAVYYNDRNALYDFYEERKGRKEAFWFFDCVRRWWYDVLIGMWDGKTLAFNIPGCETEGVRSPAIWATETGDQVITQDGKYFEFTLPGAAPYPNILINGIEVFDFAFSKGAGVGPLWNKCDLASWGSLNAHQIGDLITANFYGYLLIKGSFENDRMVEEIYMPGEGGDDWERLSWTIYDQGCVNPRQT